MGAIAFRYCRVLDYTLIHCVTYTKCLHRALHSTVEVDTESLPDLHLMAKGLLLTRSREITCDKWVRANPRADFVPYRHVRRSALDAFVTVILFR